MQLFMGSIPILCLYYHSGLLVKALFAVILYYSSTINYYPIYVRPQTRVPIYVYGILMGIFYREYTDEKPQGTTYHTFSKLARCLRNCFPCTYILYYYGWQIVYKTHMFEQTMY